ncbi:hypothetical protein AAW14_25200 [Streptomyces hygroscopicus]|uniref:recombinase family protein n=1 Tax=Streptomyces hygroscopicus TaxID=1912 RepID=UPI00223EAC46|nr:recombinase family protein [Streptomyces hygroscopicus]MCW7945202.1 hypothetical protein [Streptomyces hygroscopicus]
MKVRPVSARHPVELTRWLTSTSTSTSTNTPTRTGKARWDRSVVWGMLRNPAYMGSAVFGKTMIVHESPGLNRIARLEGRSTPRAIKAVDRPRKEWIEIPVPAIISHATFERAAQRLADNKKYASRNSKVPSLLQGLAACAGCGYGYYRTSTRTKNRKIYYYRCLGSDDYRYEGGRICPNKPVRADYLDKVVWEHITTLLADPHLIRTEIDKTDLLWLGVRSGCVGEVAVHWAGARAVVLFVDLSGECLMFIVLSPLCGPTSAV